MVFRLTVKLNTVERNALTLLAQEELRSLPDQVRVIVREEFVRRGLLELASNNDLHDQGTKE